MEHTRFIGLDIHKERISVAIAESGRSGAVEYFDEIANDPGAISKLCYRLRRPGKRQVKEMLVTAAETRGGRAVERATTLLEGVLEDEGWLD